MRILISAYACAPGRGSEPGVGWNWVAQVSRAHDVWVLLPENERAAVEDSLRRQPMERTHFVFCDLPSCIRPSNQHTTVRFALHYYLWQFVAWNAALRLHRQVGFDIVHHVTLGAYWKPCLPGLLPVPFLLGPVGGGEPLPPGFWKFLPWRGRVFERIRLAVQRAAELDPLVRLSTRRSALALAKTSETRARLRALGARQTLVMPEAGMSAEDLAWLGTMPVRTSGPFRLLSLGRMLHWKGFELSVRAFAEFHKASPDAEYWLVGEGPNRERLMRIAAELGVSRSIRFWGYLPRAEAIAKLADCDVLVHPSLHDSGGWVCLEAMSAARPVVCLDAGGPGVQVTTGTGIKIRPRSPQQVIGELAAAFLLLADNPALRHELGHAGRAHVHNVFAWEKRREQLLALYAQLVPGAPTAEPDVAQREPALSESGAAQ